MTTRIRPFDAATDADRVARFINDHGTGPAVTGLPLDGASLLASIQETGVRLLLVAESRGAIVGTLAYARMSGRRVAPEGHLFAVMFVVERTLRGGFLVGELFAESFRRFPSLGLRTLRLEVDPANQRAFPLYVRVGFRNVASPRPDEDGYLELVNHLPGISSTLVPGESGLVGPSGPGSETRSLRAAREESLTGGVRIDGAGRTLIDYQLRIGTSRIEAVVHGQTGELVSGSVDGEPAEIPDAEVAPQSRAAHPPLRHEHGGFRAELDVETGTLTVRHRDRLGPVLVDAFPVCGDTPAGVRRPAVTRVSVSQHGGAWTTTSEHLTRVVTVRRGSIELNVTQNCGHLLTASPWSGFRDAELTVSARGRDERSAHVVRGIWPPEATDFEPAVGPAHTYEALGVRASWHEKHHGIGIDVTGLTSGIWRVEGPHLARISGHGTIAYRIELRDGQQRRMPMPTPTPMPMPTPTPRGPRTRAPHEAEGLTPGGGLDVSAATGLHAWRHRGIHVLESSQPRSRSIGPLNRLPAAAWVARLRDRTTPDHGVEWALHDASFALDGSSGDERRWSVQPNADFSAIDISLSDPTRAPGTDDLAVFVFVPATAEHIDFGDGPDAKRLSIAGAPWRTWTRAFRFPTPAGDVLVEPTDGDHTEVLLRAGPAGVLATLLARPAGEERHARWRLTLV
ncbi:GNAT family N-acetyltransferase [Pseudoclavibacter sp. VKM Ac-2867]|uniref:GNAT family N-acetyltransferase n=1 Tax=Pseudoclavibacter sp. VKM Ac-2867 TaxID=2783829 RepID=UPI00188AD5F8|nr:GNAT family N-acetyltransferase [Pseudoclavibacter sp. VKM Ac-2867]MBF4457705.1 GNAT family N-acetyltransferase [Pseudoclavibacter sp. VKM Ac-2867]